MNLQLLKQLEDLKEEHLLLYQELCELRNEGHKAFKQAVRQEFIDYFSKNGFARDDSGNSGVTMRYKRSAVSLHEYVSDVFSFKMRDTFEHTVHVHQDCDGYKPTHVNEKLTLEDRIAHEIKAIEALKASITNFMPCRSYLTVDKQQKQYDGFSEIIDKTIGQ